MNPEAAPKLADDTQRDIFILAVVTPKHAAEVERIVSHTRWHMHAVSSIREALQAIQSLPISVVFCEDTLSDGKWLDLMRETERLCPRPQTIVLSPRADATLWGEVLNCGGYDLLPMPLEPHEVYAIVPMAWRQWARTGKTGDTSAARNRTGSVPQHARLSDGREAQSTFGSCGAIHRPFAERASQNAVEVLGGTSPIRQAKGVLHDGDHLCHGAGRIAREVIESRCKLV